MDAEQKGDHAAQILESEVYKEAQAGARERLKQAWTNAQSANEREALWHKYQAVEELNRQLVIIRDRGIMERKRKESERA